MLKRSSKLLSPRNMSVLISITNYRILTTEQIRTLHFSELAPKSEAPRVLLSRLASAKLIQKHLSYARSTVDSDGLSVTKPIACWSMPKRCHHALEKLLCSLGRSEEMAPFQFNRTSFNHSNSFSDQSLAHEIGLSQALISFDRAASGARDIETFAWLRSSPRHPLTAAKLAGGTVNPDAVIFIRVRRRGNRYPYIFYVEYESGTNTASQYSKKKLSPYAAYMSGRGHPPLRAVVARFSEEFGLGLLHPDRLRLRVLTISKTEAQSVRLHLMAQVGQARAFLFSDLDRLSEDPLGQIWLRNGPGEESSTRYAIP